MSHIDGMSTAQTVLAYINGLKWPVFAGGVIVWLRAPIGDLLDRVSSSTKGAFTGFGLSLSWEGGLDTAEKKAQAIDKRIGRHASEQWSIEPEAPWAQLQTLARTEPSAAVILAFKQVELALRERANALGTAPSQRWAASTRLIDAAGLPPDVARLARDLSILRNKAIHTTDDPKPDEAIRYVRLAKEAVESLLSTGVHEV